MVLNFIRFVGIILLVTFTTHYFLFFSWVRFFDIQSLHTKAMIFIVLAFGSVTFILASILIHISNQTITRIYYLLSGIWMGLLTFFLMATIILWGITFFLWLFKHQIHMVATIKTFSVFFYGLAVVYTAICHYQFYQIKLRHMQVPVRNLPSQWDRKKIIHLSDLHLGGAQDIRFLQKVVYLTNREKPDLIVITGDLFDGATASMERYIPVLETLTADQGILFTSGNHEMYSGIDRIRNIIQGSKITLLDNRAVFLDGIQILGIAYPEFNSPSFFDFSDPEAFKPGVPTILLYHTPTRIKNGEKNNAGIQSADYLSPDTTFSAAMNHGISLQLSGHTHAGQFFPYTWVANRIFKGFHHGLHRIDNFYINISAGTGSWGPPLRSGYPAEIGVITLVKEGV